MPPIMVISNDGQGHNGKWYQYKYFVTWNAGVQYESSK